MGECRHYSVADFLFSVEAEKEVFSLMTNYEPFLTENTGEKELFHLSVVEHLEIEDTDREHVFTDTSDDDMPRIEVYRVGGGWMLQVSMYKDSEVCTRLWADVDFHEAKMEIMTKNIRFSLDNACMLLYAFASAKLGALEMHASVTVKDGKGYLFLGKSGTGKSTHSALWQDAFDDARLLNDDNPILRLLPDGEVRVYGSPWSGKTPCYINKNVPVGAIVKLSQAPHNEIRPLRLPEAYAYMLSSASGLKIVPEMMDALYATIAKIIQTVQVYGLECLPNVEAARVCHAMVTHSN